MRIPEQMILSALQQGVCIKTFYRLPARTAGSQERRLPDGYVLESPYEKNEIILSHTDFQAVVKWLSETARWEQVVGCTLFGGSTWTRHSDMSDTTG